MKQKTPLPEPTGKALDTETMRRQFTFQATEVFGESVDKLPARERHLINALRRFYAYRHNGFLLVEALEICTRNQVNPPTWVLVSINEAFQKFKEGHVTLERALCMGKQYKKEYGQYRQYRPLMAKVHKRINNDPKRRIRNACTYVANRNGMKPNTLEKYYRDMWLGFFDYVTGK